MRRCFLALALVAVLVPPLASAASESEGGEDAESARAQDAGAAGDEATAADEGGEEEAASAQEESASDESGAESADEEGEAEDEGACPDSQPLCAYFHGSSSRFLTGLNGILTAPADPVGATLHPPKAFDKAKPPALRRSLAFGAGFLQMLYRTFQGAVDLGLAVVPGLPVVSPVPRYKLVPGFTHEDE